MSTYLSTAVLDEEPNRGDENGDAASRRLFILDGGLGLVSADTFDAAPSWKRTFEWLCFTRADRKALRIFLADRRGRRVPFWLPSWEADLELLADVGAADPTITVRAVGYSARMWPNSGARRHFRFRSRAGISIDRKITDAVDNADGTETLTLSAALGSDFAARQGLVMNLRLCRLDQDEVEIEHMGGTARAIIPFREIPLEAPL